MRKLILTLIILTVAGTYFWDCSRKGVAGSMNMLEQNLKGEINSESAIRMAQQHAAKNNIDPLKYDASSCEVGLGWRVYLEPSAGQAPSEVLEYVLTKKGGMVVASVKLSGRKNSEKLNNSGSLPVTAGEAGAIATAKQDAGRIYDLASQQLTVCELKNFWRIIFTPPIHLTGGGAAYLIDKSNGRITDKKYYQ